MAPQTTIRIITAQATKARGTEYAAAADNDIYGSNTGTSGFGTSFSHRNRDDNISPNNREVFASEEDAVGEPIETQTPVMTMNLRFSSRPL